MDLNLPKTCYYRRNEWHLIPPCCMQKLNFINHITRTCYGKDIQDMVHGYSMYERATIDILSYGSMMIKVLITKEHLEITQWQANPTKWSQINTCQVTYVTDGVLIATQVTSIFKVGILAAVFNSCSDSNPLNQLTLDEAFVKYRAGQI